VISAITLTQLILSLITAGAQHPTGARRPSPGRVEPSRAAAGSTSRTPAIAVASWSRLLTPATGATRGAPPASHASTTALRLVPSSAATSASTARRRAVPGWSKPSGTGRSARSYAPDISGLYAHRPTAGFASA